MAGTRKQTNSQGVGVATESLLLKSPDLGVSGVQDAKPKITLSDDDLSSLDENARGSSQCKVAWILSQVDDAQIPQLKKVFDNPSIHATKIADLLNRYGFAISYSSILRHRKRLFGSGCRCPK